MHGDVVEQHGIGFGNEHEQAFGLAVAIHDMDPASRDQRAVVVEHGSGLSADAVDVVRVGRLDDGLDSRPVLRVWPGAVRCSEVRSAGIEPRRRSGCDRKPSLAEVPDAPPSFLSSATDLLSERRREISYQMAPTTVTLIRISASALMVGVIPLRTFENT